LATLNTRVRTQVLAHEELIIPFRLICKLRLAEILELEYLRKEEEIDLPRYLRTKNQERR